ncbi:hypothetical protein TREMEDRAFT_66921 [Tremella mesenterica DSM 1558]|uniref:uncharacterized protein n=1 Tax=Tremella mesenterica (strain ATCC 24925 / CBS 8224 / DSM 1558 / NBRC 9311 / NRRL Y-6157 / RJB 2259-6 / UBC 559-6) TaxID=578456 RepID=UPI0003F48E7C|nr:uncharacterized protein TREMEDRAFT_66921 [Tremella mesenterica DSM 1558]EIW72508.1 hypothetical protein TREMEDRAFT_66921 [Tremella mesenterica DSM 1558]
MAISEETARNELGELFHEAVTTHPDVMAECLSILRLYNLTPSTLYYKYEAFLLSRPSGLRARLSILSLDTIRELRKEIQREQQAKAIANMSPAQNENTPVVGVGVRKAKGNMSDLGGFLDGLTTPSRPMKNKSSNGIARLSNTSNNANVPSPLSNDSYLTPSRQFATPTTASSYRPGPSKLSDTHLSTPVGKSGESSRPSSPLSGNESSLLTPQPNQPFSQRSQPNSLVETLNPHLSSALGYPLGTTKYRVGLSTSEDVKDWGYRYMFEKISQRSEALDDMIDDFADIIKDSYGITELGDPHFASEEDIYAVGRILSPPTDSSKVSTQALYLESSRLLGSGRRVQLRFSPGIKVRGGAAGVKSFGLFPGCLICVKGRNGGGGVFVADEVLLPPPSPMHLTTVPDLLAMQHGDKLAGQPIFIMTAAGPFTLDDDLLYHPLEALVEVVIAERPDVLVLLGPFVDANHPFIANGAVLQTSEEIFKDQVGSRLQRIIEGSPGTMIILSPSVRDTVSKHMAFPQAMLDKELLGIPKRVRTIPNPCTFSINEITISLSSVDVLFHLRREELVQRAEEAEPDSELKGQEVKDPMAGLVRHVLGQRTFYPIFPPPEVHATEVNLDVTHHVLLKMSSAPDVLILPSKLRHFSKIVDSTLVINPSHLSRPHTGGTFAKLVVHPLPRAELERDMAIDGGLEEMREHNVWERARSEIWRI